MNEIEARNTAKSIYLQAASMAGLEVSTESPEALSKLVERSYDRVDEHRRPEAVANMLRIVAMALEMAQQRGDRRLGETSVPAASEKVCPVYPFD